MQRAKLLSVLGERTVADLPRTSFPQLVHLLSDLTGVDGVVCDDRALTRRICGRREWLRIPLMSTLDILEELLARASITMLQWRTARHQLRSAGASIMPVQVAELAHAAERTGKLLSAEMRSYR